MTLWMYLYALFFYLFAPDPDAAKNEEIAFLNKLKRMNNADIEYIRSVSEPAENDPQIAEINSWNTNIDSIVERVQTGNGHNPATCRTCKEVLERYNSEQTTSV